jgi:hypothetical protein
VTRVRRLTDKELGDQAGGYAVIKRHEIEYEERHPDDLGRWRAEPNLEDLAIAIGARMEAMQGFCPVTAFAAAISVSGSGAPEELRTVARSVAKV